MRRRDWSQGHTFYRAVVRQKAGGQEEGGSGCGTSMVLVTGDGNREGEMMKCDRFRMGREGGGEAASRCRRRMT
jgi:hypothetical protein